MWGRARAPGKHQAGSSVLRPVLGAALSHGQHDRGRPSLSQDEPSLPTSRGSASGSPVVRSAQAPFPARQHSSFPTASAHRPSGSSAEPHLLTRFFAEAAGARKPTGLETRCPGQSRGQTRC